MGEQANDTFRTKAKRDRRKVKNLKCPKKKNEVIICKVMFKIETNKTKEQAEKYYKNRYPDFEIVYKEGV